jgi:hypothetical protein
MKVRQIFGIAVMCTGAIYGAAAPAASHMHAVASATLTHPDEGVCMPVKEFAGYAESGESQHLKASTMR